MYKRQAQEHYRVSQRIREELAEKHPENTDIVRDAAIAQEKLANVLMASGERAAALECQQKSLEIFERLAETDPRNVLARRSLAISYLHLADLLGSPAEQNLGRTAEAIAHYQRVIDLLSRADSSDAKAQSTLTAARDRLRRLQTPSAP